jgi:hypothetical protein
MRWQASRTDGYPNETTAAISANLTANHNKGAEENHGACKVCLDQLKFRPTVATQRVRSYRCGLGNPDETASGDQSADNRDSDDNPPLPAARSHHPKHIHSAAISRMYDGRGLHAVSFGMDRSIRIGRMLHHVNLWGGMGPLVILEGDLN